MNGPLNKVNHSLFIICFCYFFVQCFIVYGQNKTGFQLYSIGDGSILPVEIVYFKYELENKNVKLLWGTATEINNYGWDVLRSYDFNQWNKIGFVPGSMGQSNSPRDYSFIDTSITQNATYYYKLRQIDTDGFSLYTDTIKVIYDLITGLSEPFLIKNFKLMQNYPNPFNPNTIIKYQIPADGLVTIKLYNYLGKEIAVLINEEQSVGIHMVRFSTINYHLTSGVYFYKIEFNANEIRYSSVRKMILLK